MRARQDDRRSTTGVQRFFPAFGAHAPAVARRKPRKPRLGCGRSQVVAARGAELQKLLGDARAHDVRSQVCLMSVAAAISEEAGLGPVAARLERPPHDALARRDTRLVSRGRAARAFALGHTPFGRRVSAFASDFSYGLATGLQMAGAACTLRRSFLPAYFSLEGRWLRL